MKGIITLLFSFIYCFTLHSQMNLKGIVYDATFHEPVPFAHIVNSENGKGTISDENGIFNIEINQGKELIVSAIGYKSEKIIIEETSEITIYLTSMKYLLNEVNVYASSKTIETATSSTSLRAKEAEQLAGMTRDIFRSVQMLPGVSTNNEISANFQVRGGSYEENLVLINGIRVNEPFHIKAEPMASVGIFNIDLIKNIDFLAGGFSAEYGDVLSGVLNVDYREGNRDKFEGKIYLSLLDLGFDIEGPVTKKSSFVLGARHSYLDYMMKVAGASEYVDLGYYDIQGKYDYRFSSRHKISLTAIYSDDYMRYGPRYWTRFYEGSATIHDNYTPAESNNDYYEHENDDYSNTLISLSSNNVLNDKFSLKTEYSYYSEYENEKYEFNRDQYTLFEEFPEYFYTYNLNENYYNSLTINTHELKSRLMMLISHAHSVSAGIYYRTPLYKYTEENIQDRIQQENISDFPDTVSYSFPDDPNNYQLTEIETHSYFTGGYVQHHWQINNRLILNSGIRFDYFDFNRDYDINPRFNLAYQVSKNTKIKGAWGIFSQSPNYRQLKDTIAYSGNTQNQRAIHYILGVEQKLSDKTRIKCEAYYKDYTDLIPVRRSHSGRLIYDEKDITAEGYAYGMDIEFLYRGDKLNFMATYGLLDAKEKDKDETEYYSRYTDQTHSLSAILGLILPRRFELSLRGFYGSGYTYQQMIIEYNEEEGYDQWQWPELTITGRFPAYKRLDLRASKEFGIKNNQLLVYLDIINVFNFRNVFSYRYTYNREGEPIINTINLFPLLPTLGISFSF